MANFVGDYIKRKKYPVGSQVLYRQWVNPWNHEEGEILSYGTVTGYYAPHAVQIDNNFGLNDSMIIGELTWNREQAMYNFNRVRRYRRNFRGEAYE